MYGAGEHENSLGSGPIWVYLTYQTAFVDDAGKLQTRRDLYNLDPRTLNAIKNARATNPAPERKSEPVAAAPSSGRACAAPQRRPTRAADAYPSTYPSIFATSAPRVVRTQPVRSAPGR